jgi:hypothetical protein
VVEAKKNSFKTRDVAFVDDWHQHIKYRIGILITFIIMNERLSVYLSADIIL